MNLSTKASSLQAYNMLVYKNALHPEFFGIESRHRIEYGEYEFEAWIFRGGHALRFQHDETCIVEVVCEDAENLPDRGRATTLPCAGERDHEAKFGDHVIYMTSIQTEILTEHLYLGTYREMLEHGSEGQTLMSVWEDHTGKPNMSLVDMQRFNDELHVQSYHLRSDCGLVLRTQSIFQVSDEVNNEDEDGDADSDSKSEANESEKAVAIKK